MHFTKKRVLSLFSFLFNDRSLKNGKPAEILIQQTVRVMLSWQQASLVMQSSFLWHKLIKNLSLRG